jgi:hypothetical protein
MHSAAALHFELRPSRWQQGLRWLLCALVALTLGFHVAPWLAAVLSLLSICVLRPWHTHSAQTLKLSDDACQIDARPSEALTAAADELAPTLQSIWQWLGLIWIQNSAKQTLLIWPDQLSVDQHRSLKQSLKRASRKLPQ